ncbi:MAG: type II secretion system F family protein [Chloroflexi bacterium]|nr:type II secretion system F family protein [Chloroflexota bacterium]MCH8869425.1 type II secretion system F family protein [Chloroflexota bacterium]MCI0770702.1 type II secretion system F family protein [Chloroflexota bacterium]MCI0790498.1 type II secretion system F family protein [Chloroflexota bacterium]MCI0796002.1 type II secretion system F family protein [Chloroflexota bacterium]
MQYKYLAYNLDEGIIKGWVEARNAAEVRDELVEHGYKPLDVSTGWHPPTVEDLMPSLFKVGTGELVRFSRQLATMVTSGASLILTLEMLHSDSNSRGMKRTLTAIRKTLDEGGSLSEALAAHPKVFSSLYVSVVQVGEMTGRLGLALEQLSDILEAENEAKQKAIRTMMYPLAIISLSMVTLFVLMTVALPPLLAVFENMGAEIPAMTRFIVSAMAAFKEHFVALIVSAVVFFIGFKILRRIPSFRRAMAMAMARSPILGSFIVSGEISRLSRTLSLLLEAGVTLAEALKLAIGGIKNQILRDVFLEAEESLLTGHGLSDPLKNHSILPTMFVELVTLGEQSNSLQSTMSDVADAYQKQLERQLDSLLGMLEPASTVVVGGIVGFIAFSMFVPIYSGLNAVP